MRAYSKTVQGGRAYQEDRYINATIGKDVYMNCIFDGHGGDVVSEFLKNNLTQMVKQELCNGNTHDIPFLLRRVFATADRVIQILDKPYVGSTAVVCLFVNNKLFCANAGDSMAMIKCINNTTQYMSIDHKVDNPHETARIRNTGGMILYDTGMGRVSGTLNLARSLGDFYLKPWVIPDPYMRSENITNIKYVFLASDGVWDVMEKDDVDLILNNVSHSTASKLVEDIIMKALEKGSTDNITATLILKE